MLHYHYDTTLKDWIRVCKKRFWMHNGFLRKVKSCIIHDFIDFYAQCWQEMSREKNQNSIPRQT